MTRLIFIMHVCVMDNSRPTNIKPTMLFITCMRQICTNATVIRAPTRENLFSVFPFRPDTNPAVQLQKMARSLKCLILKEGELFYLCSENKGTDHLSSVTM